MEPIKTGDGDCTFFVGVQCDVTEYVNSVLREGSSIADWKCCMAQVMKEKACNMGFGDNQKQTEMGGE